MAANDAFTAGVRPGGLTDSTQIRLLLCYLVKNAGPIARTDIENALMDQVRKRGEQTGLDTLVVHAVNDVDLEVVPLRSGFRS